MILTVQLGGFANFIGTHWWNLQESTFIYEEKEASSVEVEHDILFRQGLSRKGEVIYNPRLLAFDLKGSVGPCTEAHDVNLEDVKKDIIWEGNQEVHSSQDTERSHSMEVALEKPNCAWTDFLKTNLHPQSLTILTDYLHESSTEPFDLFPLGTSIMNKEERRETTEDLIRRYVEECDFLQGFQIISDAHNGFSGMASSIFQHLEEEYSSKSAFSYPVLPTVTDYNNGRAERLTNTALLLTDLFETSSMICPISLDPSWASTGFRKFDHLDYQAYLPYHQGAIIATALDTATLPMRYKRSPRMSMSELESNLVVQGCKAVGISCAIPIPQRVTSVDSLKWATTGLVPLSPAVDRFQDCRTQSLAWRGLGEPRNLQPVLDQWSALTWDSALTVNSIFRSPCPAQSPYPQFFSSNVEQDGYYSSHELPPPREDVLSFASTGGFHCSNQMGQSLKQLHSDISKFNVKKLHRFVSLGIEEDDLLENRYLLTECSNRYEEI